MARTTDTLSLTADRLAEVRRSPAARHALVAQRNRRHNLSLVLQALWSGEPLTRPQLATTLGLSVPTVTSLVDELLREGLVHSLGVITPSRVGKPPTSVGIDKDTNGVVVLDLTGDRVFSGSVVTLSGSVVGSRDVPIGDATGERAVREAADLADALRTAAPVRVIGVGVASPGLVDADGVVRVADRLGWSDVNVAGVVAETTSLPVVVRNDVDCMALGRRRFQDSSSRDLVVVALENGVGAAVMIDGRTVTGERFAAGEIGHISVDPQGEPCVCGRRGCLDLLVSARQLTMVLEARGPQIHDQVLKRAGSALGGVLGPVLSMLNIAEILVVGPTELYQGMFEQQLRATLRAGNLPALTSDVEVTLVSDSAELILLGAAASVIETVLGVS